MTTHRPEPEFPSKIHRIFHDPHYPPFKLWARIVNGLIYLSCVALALDSISSIDQEWRHLLDIVEWVSVLFFTLDYVGNIYTARRPLAYALSFWGIVDLLSILPTLFVLFNFTSLKATKLLRLLRVIRVLRVLKLARAAVAEVNAANEGTANRIVANLRIYVIALFATLMISSTAMYYVEGGLYTPEAMLDGQARLDRVAAAHGNPAGSGKFAPHDPLSGATIPEDKRFFTSIPEAMWWSITTLTTTGYGDLYPVTVGGRMVAAATMLMGLVLFGILMNIVGRTLMVLLFGEHPEGHHGDAAAAPPVTVGAALDLLVARGVLSAAQADDLAAGRRRSGDVHLDPKA